MAYQTENLIWGGNVMFNEALEDQKTHISDILVEIDDTLIVVGGLTTEYDRLKPDFEGLDYISTSFTSMNTTCGKAG